MARNQVLIDTGPLVALLAENDSEHERCTEQSRALATPMLTTWPVLTEAAWLLRNETESIPRILALVELGLIECIELGRSAGPAIAELAAKYSDLRPQLADLSLVYIADQEQISTIFTLDNRDFAVYRNRQGHPFQLIP